MSKELNIIKYLECLIISIQQLSVFRIGSLDCLQFQTLATRVLNDQYKASYVINFLCLFLYKKLLVYSAEEKK